MYFVVPTSDVEKKKYYLSIKVTLGPAVLETKIIIPIL